MRRQHRAQALTTRIAEHVYGLAIGLGEGCRTFRRTDADALVISAHVDPGIAMPVFIPLKMGKIGFHHHAL
jgi:hypothetical protein